MDGTSGSAGATSGSAEATTSGAPEECPSGMILVSAGEFQMGSMMAGEGPVRQVTLSSYCIDEMEVTIMEYEACVSAGACSERAADSECHWGPDHPVNCVPRDSAIDYCAWMSRRLPTEAEWEKAARGEDGHVYPWGNTPEPSCIHVVMDTMHPAGGEGCDEFTTWPGGSKPLGASPYGAMDMAGNVYEWVSDWYAEQYDPTQLNDPQGPESGTWGVLRGGAYVHGIDPTMPLDNPFRTTARYGVEVDTAPSSVGFRCATTPS